METKQITKCTIMRCRICNRYWLLENKYEEGHESSSTLHDICGCGTHSQMRVSADFEVGGDE